jgi:hypothetical protein
VKTLKSLVLASLALASSVAAQAGISARGWLESYYLNPQPAELPGVVATLSREGYFEQPGHTAIAIGFLGTVFAQHPDRVDGWLRELGGLPENHQRLLAAALWQAGSPRGTELLAKLSDDSAVRLQVLQLARKGSEPVADTPVLSASSMNLQWGAFLATGNEKYVLNVLGAIGTGQAGLDTATRISLARHAASHPRVLDICRAQLDRQPSDVREVLRAAVNAATPASSGI